MGGNYNGWLGATTALRTDGTVELIRRAETIDDLFATLKFEPKLSKKLKHKDKHCTCRGGFLTLPLIPAKAGIQ